VILGLCGLAGSGKDTAADALVKDFGFTKVSLADPLKRFCKDVFAFTDEQLWGPSEKRNAPDTRYPSEWSRAPEGSGAHDFQGFLTPRYALQQLGTEWGRACYENVWIDYALRAATTLLDSAGTARTLNYTAQTGIQPAWLAPKGVIIPDVRFKNEVDAIRRGGGIVWRLERPSAGLRGVAGQHASETEQESIDPSLFDAVLLNDGTVAELKERARGLLRRFLAQGKE
jgi:hypothetical protein